MKFRLIPAVLLSVLFVSQPAPAQNGSDPLRVVAWNIEWFPGKYKDPNPGQEEEHAKLVQQELKNIDPDIVLAQEIRDWQSFADLVAGVPGLNPAVVSPFTSEYTGEYWNQQLAIASKLPVMAAWSEPWKEGADAIIPRRGFSAAVLRMPGDSGKLLLVYSVHLKSNRAKDAAEEKMNHKIREESIRQLTDHIKHLEDTVFPGRIAGVIVGGDFNTNHDGQFGDKTIALMERAGFTSTWGFTPRVKRLTWRGNERFDPTTFDYIFTKGLPRAQAELLEPPAATSDHRPILVEIPR